MIDPNRTVELIKGALFDSEATWRAYLPEAQDWQKTAFLLTGPLIVTSTVLAYLIALIFAGDSLFGQYPPTIVSSLLNLVTASIAAGVVAFIFSALAGVFGGKSNFALGLAATSLAFVPGYVGQAITWLPWIGGILAFALFIYGLVLLWRILPIYLEVPDSKRAGHYVVSMVASIIVMFILGSVVGRLLYGAMPGSALTGLSGLQSSGGSSTSVVGGMARQAELISQAQEDRYSPPDDGELTERQVREFIRVLDRASEVQAEKAERLKKLAEKADKNEQMSMSDLGAMMSSASDLTGLQTAEIEVVKSAGGNWAEHQWVRDSLRTAWLQKDINAAVAHNFELYKEYEGELQDAISR